MPKTDDETREDETRDDDQTGTDDTGQDDDAGDAAQRTDGDDKAGDDGTDWKREARKWERQAKANADKAKRVDEIDAANKTEAEKLTAERDALLEKSRTATQRAVKAEVRATAAGLKFRDPADAQRLLDLDELADEDGEVDAEAIQAALKKIAKAKPYLLASEGGGRSGGDFSGGTGTGNDAAAMSVDEFRKARRKRT